MRYEFADCEWAVIRPMLPNKPRRVPRIDDRRALNRIFWVLRSGAPWRDLAHIVIRMFSTVPTMSCVTDSFTSAPRLSGPGPAGLTRQRAEML